MLSEHAACVSSTQGLAILSTGLSEMECPSMTAPLPRDVARHLPRAMLRLPPRLRNESAPASRRWTWSQLTTLRRIVDEGPTTVSALAASEHARHQSMGEKAAALRQTGRAG